MERKSRAIALLVLFPVISSGCLDKSDYYSDIREAREDRVFEKGWLPDILPESAYDLEVVTSVESSSGRGRFKLDPGDYQGFAEELLPYDGGMSKIEGHNRSIRSLLDEQYEAFRFSSRTTDWIFLCDQQSSTCEFFVWQ